jgi:TonB family C-terminal domain
MLSTLIESRRTRSRNGGGTAASVIVHALLITLVAAVTAHASDDTPARQPPPPDVVYIEPVNPVPPSEPASPDRPQAPSEPTIPTIVYTQVDVPLDIPTDIPQVNISLPPIDPTNPVIGGAEHRATNGTGSSPSSGSSGVYSAWQVEKSTVPLPGNPKPVYPSMLQSARVDGEVLAQFVVDSTGRVDMSTFRAIQATDELFVQSVRRALAEWKFLPAEVEGRKVRQLVQMPLTFKVR